MNFWNESEAKRLFQELSLYNTFNEKTRIKYLRNLDLLHKLQIYDELRKYGKHLTDMQGIITLK